MINVKEILHYQNLYTEDLQQEETYFDEVNHIQYKYNKYRTTNTDTYSYNIYVVRCITCYKEDRTT